MSVRSQAYLWDSGRLQGTTTPLPVGTANNNAGQQFSIFTGGFGNNLPIPAYTEANQFIVIDHYGLTPTLYHGVMLAQPYRGLTGGVGSQVSGPRAYLQIRINTTGYFEEPDNVSRDGLPGTLIPYPRTTWYDNCMDESAIEPIYILPGQTWDALVTYYNTLGFLNGGLVNGFSRIGELQAFMKYTLYDGPDCIIALRLLEEGISITPNNVDWFKKNLIRPTESEDPPDA